jgi:8-oxo-dGTP pyrophosphatase MutT (NUDIX family)
MNIEVRGKWKVIDKKVEYQNQWIKVIEHKVIRPDGTEGIYGVLDAGNNSGVVAVDEDMNIVLLKEFLFPFATTTIQIPSGQVVDEDPLVGAKRELLEETGIRAANWISLGECYLSGGISTQVSFLFLATDLSYGESELEETEDISVIRIPIQRVLEMCFHSEIKDSVSLIGIYRAVEYLRRYQLDMS